MLKIITSQFNKLTQTRNFIGYCSGACDEYSWLNYVLYDVTCHAKAHQTLFVPAC